MLDPAAALAPGAPLVHEEAGALRQGVRRRHRRATSARAPSSARATSTRPGPSATSSSKATFQTQAQAHLSLEPCGALAEVDAGGPHHAVVGEPVGVPRPGQRVRVARPADDQAALPDAARSAPASATRWSRTSSRSLVLLAMKARRTVKLILSARGGLRDGARAPSVHDPHEDRREARRHAGRARDRAAARRRRLRRRQPRRARLRAADELRPVPHPARARARPRRLHQQAALRRLPRLRRAAGDLRVGDSSSTRSRSAGHRPDRAAPPQHASVAATPGSAARRSCSNGLAECLDIVERESGWQHARSPAPTRGASPASAARGFGVALSAHISGLLASGAIVRVLEDGSVLLNTGAVDIGQGSNTVLTQICARGAASCRSSGWRSPAPTPTARPTTGARPRAASPT